MHTCHGVDMKVKGLLSWSQLSSTLFCGRASLVSLSLYYILPAGRPMGFYACLHLPPHYRSARITDTQSIPGFSLCSRDGTQVVRFVQHVQTTEPDLLSVTLKIPFYTPSTTY